MKFILTGHTKFTKYSRIEYKTRCCEMLIETFKKSGFFLKKDQYFSKSDKPGHPSCYLNNIDMGKVRNILESKSKIIFSVSPDTSVYIALEVMFDKNISSLLVLENNQPVGIFTERDYARKIALKGRNSRDTRMSEIMTKNLITITPDYTIEDAMRIMTEKHIRHLPVLENEKLIGVISIGDLVKYLIEEQKFIIGNLENYIGRT